jgi:histone H3/H4
MPYSFAVDQIGPAMDESLWHQPFPDPDIDTGITAATSDQTQAQPQFPSPVETRTTSVGPCTCFSIMFLAISDLQSLNNTSYPAAVPHLRSAMKTAAEIINCERCPKEAFSAIQNVQSSTAILSALAERFHKVLYEINREASELESEQRRKTITMGDMSAQNMHLHTGTPDCPMKFDVQLEPSDWKKYAKQALKREVFGNPQSTTNTSLMGLVEAMAKRQHAWHADKSFHTEERVRMFGLQEKCMEPGETATCQRMVHQIRRMVEAIDWTD